MTLIMVTTGLLCFGQSSKSTPDSVYIGTDSVYVGPLDSKNGQTHKPSTKRNENIFNTRYEYTESNGVKKSIVERLI